jgi:hypothetical protein
VLDGFGMMKFLPAKKMNDPSTRILSAKWIDDAPERALDLPLARQVTVEIVGNEGEHEDDEGRDQQRRMAPAAGTGRATSTTKNPAASTSATR